ncbi:MAG: hypothetical protein KF847_10135 [Pirellulales bacterium]|nr:hypothetical protein [Pirellulales bacterium]
MSIHIRLAGVAALAFATCCAAANAQTDVNWAPTGTGNWDLDSNWSGGFRPDGNFDERAIISNGGTALVNSAVAVSPGAIVLGSQVNETGSLTIANGGQLSTLFVNGNASQGNILVGGDGVGHLLVEPGGSLAVRRLVVGGLNAGSTLVVGAASGGTATIATELDGIASRDVRVIGPNVNFSALSFNWFSTSRYIPQITAATHSPIRTSGIVGIDSNGAVLRPEFSNGVVPAVGNTWNLFDAGSINGTFALDTSAAPALPFGQIYRFAAKPDPTSVNGVFGQLSVEQRLVLNVNRATGSVSIANGPSNVSIDGYLIRSALGGLKPSGWNSLQDQGVSDWRESPPNGSVNALSELKPTGSTTITQASPRNLGNAFQLPAPTQFGTELEDLTFEYYSAGGVVTQGIVNYIGNKQNNNLVLLVDPATGNARMENQSALTVNIDGYKIASASGSLLPSTGQWNSLDDQNAGGGDWRESNPTVNTLTELKPTSSTQMTGGTNFGFNLGTPFKTVGAGGTQDLTFQYLFPGDTEFRDGIVEYRAISSGLAADFNHDGTVNNADLTIWKGSFGVNASGDANNDGASNGADFLVWQRQFGQSGAVPAIGAVPEPATLGLMAATVAGLAIVNSARRRTGRAS